MKGCLIEIPYGTRLLLPGDVAHCLPRCVIVEAVNYDVNNLRATGNEIECRFVDTDRIQPVAPPSAVEVPPQSATPVEPAPGGIVTSDDLPF